MTIKIRKRTPLNRDVHIRLPMRFRTYLREVAEMNHLKPSTFSRTVLMRHVKEYHRNRDTQTDVAGHVAVNDRE